MKINKYTIIVLVTLSIIIGWCIPTPGPLEDDFEILPHKTATKNAPAIIVTEEDISIEDMIDDVDENSPLYLYVFCKKQQ